MFRKATMQDLPAITAIYDAIHTREKAGLTTTGWIAGIYPTRETARRAIEIGEMYVAQDPQIVACGRINHMQDECYKEGAWRCPADPEQVLVLHTLVVDPQKSGLGIGTAFLRFYEKNAAALGCKALRLDTNARNTAARGFYKKHGYEEVGITPCEFNGIKNVDLVLLEKVL